MDGRQGNVRLGGNLTDCHMAAIAGDDFQQVKRAVQ
jgi:hypothetical protein